MIKNTLKAIIFISVFLFLLVILSYVLRTDFTDTFTNTVRGYLAEPSGTIDVLYVGSSTVNRFWLPMEAYDRFGFTSYNVTTARLPQHLTIYLIKDALKYQSPSLLIVDLRTFAGFGTLQDREHHIRGVTDVMYYSQNRISAINNSINENEDAVAYHLDIMKYHANFENLFIAKNWYYAFGVKNYDETKAWGGYDYHNNYYAISHPLANQPEVALDDNVNAAYNELIDYLLSLDIDVMFTVTPFEERDDEYGRLVYLRRIAQERGIAFVAGNDYFDEIGLEPDVDFTDEVHATVFGAELYTGWLGRYIKNTFDLPERRGDDAYIAWERACQLWYEEFYLMKLNQLQRMPDEAAAKASARMY